MTYKERLAGFREQLAKIEYCKYTLNGLIYWDKVTYMPKNSIGYRSEVMSFIADMQYKMLTSREFLDDFAYFENNPKNDFVTDRMIRHIKESGEAMRVIPEAEYAAYIRLVALSEQVWEEARNEADFDKFKGNFSKLINTFKSFAGYWGYEEEPYDALLNYYVEGFSCKDADNMVETIREPLFSMIENKLKGQSKTKDIAPISGVSEDVQIKLWKLLLTEIGFDFDRGRVDVGAQATVLANSPSDVRIVNYYSEDDLCVGIFNVLHSGGKSVYQQNINRNLKGTLLGETPSFAMDEAIGRFYENVIGRSYAFWKRVFPKAAKIVPELRDVGLDAFYDHINRCEKTPVRISADELTYLVHVMIRYEIERALINGELDVSEAKKVWTDKYREYLGVVPSDDAEGILQDVHWAAGYVGYFPTYLLASVASAQFAKAIEAEYGNLDELILKTGTPIINKWMKEHVYKWGACYNTFELIEKACKEELNPNYYVEYLREKFEK